MRTRRLLGGRWTGLGLGLVGVVLVTVAIHLMRGHVEVLSMAVLYQLLVLAVSGGFGTLAGLATGAASVAAFNWFFLPPTQTLTIGDTRNWVAFGVFAATALITSRLGSGYRDRRRESEERRRDAELLTGLAETVLAQIGPGAPGPRVADAAARALGVERCAIDLSPAGGPGGRAARLAPAAEGFAVPLVAAGAPVGILEVGRALPDGGGRWARIAFVEAAAGLVAMAVERGRLIEGAMSAEGLRRSGELKTALLRSVSHEFRTPLTAIRTAAHALAENPGPAAAGPLAAALAEETGRLDRLVANLLDLSRLEAGALEAHLDWCDPGEMIAGALEAAEPLPEGLVVETTVDPRGALVRADAVLSERVLVNLVHNALRHGAPPVRVDARVAGAALELVVSDGGAGVDPALLDRLFDPFVAGPGTGGTGVGLALARGLAEAQGGSLRVERDGGRTAFVFSLGLAPVPQVA
ncbi:MAG: DUF4118 domain-containing protein [Thermoleophilia bacterium]